MQGKKETMDDRLTVQFSLRGNRHLGFFGAFDGHGGWSVADYAAHKLHRHIFNSPLAGTSIPEAMIDAYARTDEVSMAALQRYSSSLAKRTVIRRPTKHMLTNFLNPSASCGTYRRFRNQSTLLASFRKWILCRILTYQDRDGLSILNSVKMKSPDCLGSSPWPIVFVSPSITRGPQLEPQHCRNLQLLSSC